MKINRRSVTANIKLLPNGNYAIEISKIYSFFDLFTWTKKTETHIYNPKEMKESLAERVVNYTFWMDN
jgi:hypothetical protein